MQERRGYPTRDCAGEGTRARERRIVVGPEGQQALHAYLELSGGDHGEYTDGEALFQTEMGTPLTIPAVESLFTRLNQRLHLPGVRISPSALRDTFAVRYLQAGGGLEPLRECLGLRDLMALKRYERLSRQQSGDEAPKELREEPPPGPPSARTASKRRRRRSFAAMKEVPPSRQRDASRSGGSPRNGIVASAQDDS